MNQQDIQTNNDSNSRYLRFVDDNVSVKPFGHNTVSDRAYKRTERLILATYLLTSHLSDEEPLRENLRENARALLNIMADSVNLLNTTATLTPALLNIRKNLTLLDLLFASGLASEMNVNVLKRAYANFADFLTSSIGSLGAETVNLKDIFDETTPKITPKTKAVPRSSLEELATAKESLGTVVLEKEKTQKIKPKNSSIKARALSTNRRVIMLDMLAKTGKVTVKEVATQIPDISPKTLQRELMKLAEEGTLKKEGNKRWTTYALVR